jgi:hypothetical protein
MARSYSQSPELSLNFYAQPNADPLQNLTSSNLQQQMQLNATGLLPGSFVSGMPVPLESPLESDWYKWAPTLPAFQNYVLASGSTRIQQMARGDMKRLGYNNLLRTVPPIPLSTQTPWFFDSSHRENLVLGNGCVPRF